MVVCAECEYVWVYVCVCVGVCMCGGGLTHLQQIVGRICPRAEDEDEGCDVDGVQIRPVEIEGGAFREVIPNGRPHIAANGEEHLLFTHRSHEQQPLKRRETALPGPGKVVGVGYIGGEQVGPFLDVARHLGHQALEGSPQVVLQHHRVEPADGTGGGGSQG